ncbi:MAG: GNAT family N-acetyltransferase [Bacteroidales bacterium]|nr:GNAT family N-acetyltransferase [Bacteroidales bacterium]
MMRIETSQGIFIIRPIDPKDNARLTDIIVNSLLEFGASGDGFACNDPETQAMYEAYQQLGRKYYTLVNAETQEIVGGGGVAPLNGSLEICEFVKMYYVPEVRGLGLGRKMLELCIAEARKMGYKQMYLETLERMDAARALYEQYNFRQVKSPLGATGHFSCDAFYIREL